MYELLVYNFISSKLLCVFHKNNVSTFLIVYTLFALIPVKKIYQKLRCENNHASQSACHSSAKKHTITLQAMWMSTRRNH